MSDLLRGVIALALFSLSLVSLGAAVGSAWHSNTLNGFLWLAIGVACYVWNRNLFKND